MKRAKLFFLHCLLPVTLLAAVLLVGCVGSGQLPWSPEAKLLAARDTFNTTVNVLTAMINAEKISKADAGRIMFVAHLGQQALDRYDAAVELGQPTGDVINEFNRVLRDLVAYRLAADRAPERKKDDGTSNNPTVAPGPL